MSAHNHLCAPGLSTCAKLVQANLQVGVNSIILCKLLLAFYTEFLCHMPQAGFNPPRQRISQY